MDITNTPPRPELAVAQPPAEARLKPGDVTGRAETANPVIAADKANGPDPASERAIKPLDVFQVGDNDDLPVPPDPPRQALAMVAWDIPEPADEASPTEDQESDPREPAGAANPPDADQTAPDTALSEASPYKSGTPNPISPTVDIRR